MFLDEPKTIQSLWYRSLSRFLAAIFATLMVLDGCLVLLDLWRRVRMHWKAVVAYFAINVVKCCENYRNIVKCCEIAKMLWNRLSKFPKMRGFCQFKISQHSADAQKKSCTNFSIKVHTFCCSSIEVDVFAVPGEKRPSNFAHGSQMLWNVVKYFEIKFHNISQHFAIFHNIPRNFTTFHNIYGKVGNLSFPTHPGSPPTSQ